MDRTVTAELERAAFCAVQRIKDLEDLVMRQEQELADVRAEYGILRRDVGSRGGDKHCG